MSALLQVIVSGQFRELVICACTGAGKTTLLEVLTCYVIALDPGPMLIVGQTDETAKDWAETRLMPVLSACEPVRELYPADRHKVRKTEIILPHMPIFVTGAKMTSLQEKSVQWAFADEVWRWDQGRMQELRARHHDRWNRRSIFVSQGSDETHDFHESWQRGTRTEIHFYCPQCGCLQPYDWGQVIIPTGDEGEFASLETVKNGTRYRCVKCAQEMQDTAANRRAMADRQVLVDQHTEALSGVFSVRVPALAVWWIPWGDMAVEWVLAQKAKKDGDLQPLKQFITKRLAQFWKEEESVPWGALMGAGYTLRDFSAGQKWPGEAYRFLTVDVQLDHFWWTVRVWKIDGTSRLLGCGKAFQPDQLKSLQHQYGVKDALVLVDAQFKTGEVYDWCAKWGWTALHGSGADGFRHVDRKGRAVRKFFSPVQQAAAPSGGRCRYAFWANEPVKDRLAALRGGSGAAWETPDDVPEEYAKQIDSEMKKEIVNRKTGAVTVQWVRVRKANHLWDCEAMQVAGAMMMGVLAGEAMVEDSARQIYANAPG